VGWSDQPKSAQAVSNGLRGRPCPGRRRPRGDPVHANDVIALEGWKERTWAHFGNWQTGEVSAETWVDLHWPCFTATDEDQDCLLEDGRAMVWSASGPRSGARRSTSSAWAPVEQFCGDSSLRTWNRVTFDVRWSENYLTKGLTLPSDPTEDSSTVICPTQTTPLERRKAVRDQLLG
jgi:hypothetical protein